MIKYYCDGCRKHLEGEELAQAPQQGQPELFCSVCSELADDYWPEKFKQMDEAMRRVNNHRENFFRSRRKRLKVVK